MKTVIFPGPQRGNLQLATNHNNVGHKGRDNWPYQQLDLISMKKNKTNFQIKWEMYATR